MRAGKPDDRETGGEMPEAPAVRSGGVPPPTGQAPTKRQGQKPHSDETYGPTKCKVLRRAAREAAVTGRAGRCDGTQQ